MKGGKISGCDADIGTIYCCGAGFFEMQGGEISGNSSQGAIVLEGGCRISGGTITNNTNSAIQVWSSSPIYLSGNPVINDNYNTDNQECNISLGDGVITVEGAFTEGASIGVTMNNAGVFSTGCYDTNTADPDTYFTADDSIGTYVTKSDDGEAKPGIRP